jgi:hypothetical protein
MKRLLLAALSISVLWSGLALAENSQQNRMADCNKQATDKKGDDRKTFMSSCLSGKAATDVKAEVAKVEVAKVEEKAANPKQRMKDCNVQATGKKGDERKAFMSSCLSNKPAADAKAEVAKVEAKAADPKQRMKDCNVQATGKKGDERKSFMSSCLKN